VVELIPFPATLRAVKAITLKSEDIFLSWFSATSQAYAN